MAAAAVTPFADAAAATAAAEAVESTKARMLAWLALALALYWAGALALWWTHMKPRQREKPQWRWRDIARRARAELQRRFAARADPPPPLRRHRSGGPPRESRVPDDVRSPALVKRAATSGGRRDAASRSPDVPRRSPGTARRRPIDTPRVRAHESPARKDARRTQRRQPGPRSPDADYAPGGRGKTERRSAAWELAVDARPGGSRKQQSLVASPLRRHSRSAMVAMRPTPSARVAMPGDGDLTYKVPSSGKSTPSQKVSVFAACLSPRAASWALAAVSPVLGLLVACVDPARAARTATGPHLRPQSASGRGRIVQGEWVGMKKVPLKTLRQWHVSFGASGVQLQLNAADSGQVGVFAEQVACPPSRLYLCRRPSSSPPPPCLDMSRSTQPWEPPEV